MIDDAHIERLFGRLHAIEGDLAKPATVANPAAYRALLREHARLRRVRDKADNYRRLRQDMAGHRELLAAADTDPELRALAAEEAGAIEATLARAERELMVALLPPDPDEPRHAVVEIRAGTGGNEAALFAGDLLRMYSRYAETRGWTVKTIDAAGGDVGGIKEAVCMVEGAGAYGVLRYESGGHRVQRVPETEAQGRIHTSAATVAVFPEAEPEDAIELPADQIRVDIFRSSGPGGQSVNTTDSAVRITHLPTGLSVQCQDEKSQHRNKEKALTVLKARLLDMRRRQEAETMGNRRRLLTGSGDRSERVRTYNFPQNRVTDHRINLTLYALDRIIEGDLTALLDALRQHDIDEQLAACHA